MNQLALQSAVEYTIEVIGGPNKGDSYKIISTAISIGRSSDNDIPLTNDLKISRKHALISISSQEIKLSCLNELNLITVDKVTAKNHQLKNGSKIKIGSSTLLFQINLVAPESHLALSQQALSQQGLASQVESNIPAANNQIPNGPLPNSTKNKSKSTFYVILTIVVAATLFLLTGENKKKKNIELTTEQDIEQTIENSKKIFQAEQNIIKKSGKDTFQYKQAQANYIRGFRDFKKGQYERAVTSFEACLSILPTHPLCIRYKKLSEKKFQELIQYHMVLGARHLEQGQYQACQSAYRNVIFMVKNPQSKVYQEAKINHKICQSRLEGHY